MNSSSVARYRRIFWNPWFYWIRRYRFQQVMKRKVGYLPEPYDLSAICMKLRTGRRVASPLSGRLQLSGRSERPSSSPKSQSAAGRSAPPWLKKQFLVGGEAFALYGAETLQRISVLDANAYGAVSHLANQQLDSLADLSSYLGGWKIDLSGQLTEGGLTKLAGHLGETYAAEHLTNAGLEVVWPQASNQAGWDLMVNDHLVNVKTIADAQQLSQHFSQYPDVAALIPGDAANIPAGAFHLHPGGSVDALSRFFKSHDQHAVIVDHGLSHHDVFEHADQVSDIALGNSGVDAHIPWITVATSGWREFRLLQASKTDIGSASKNLALDVAGRGGGAFLGAKAGAAIGTALFPGVGSLIGGVLGAIGGAMAGGSVSDKLKRADLEAAMADFQRQKADLDDRSVRLNFEAQSNLRSKKRQLGSELRAAANEEKRQLTILHERYRNRRKQLESLSCEEALVLLNQAMLQVNRYQTSLLSLLEGFGLLERWVFPSVNRVAIQLALDDLVALEAFITELKMSIAGVVSRDKIFPILAQLGVAERLVNDLLKEAEEAGAANKESWLREVKASTLRVAEARVNAFKAMARFVSETVVRIREELQPHVTETQAAADKVLSEMQKLGLK